jgi:hypothetical protein
MKRAAFVLFLALLLTSIPTLTFANMSQFNGRWINTDNGTEGITAIQIFQTGSNVSVSAWGKCSPTDCAWGNTPATVYGQNVSANPLDTALAIAATFTTGFSRTMLIILPEASSGAAKVRVELFTNYTDGSNRAPYTASYIMQKQTLIPPINIPPIFGQLAPPIQVSPGNGQQFDIFPRTMTFDWKAVAGAASYTLEVDAYQYCQANKWCSDVGGTYLVVPGINATQYTHDFVGAQPGRWRVWAVFPNGTESIKSPWWEFKHLK